MAQNNKIKIRRGSNAALPAGGTEEGELRYSSDTQELYVDDGATNVKIGSATTASGAVSTAQQAALDLKAPLASPTFTGSIVTPIVAGDGTTVKLRPEGAADDDGELRITKGANGTVLTFTSVDGVLADVTLYRSAADTMKTDDSLEIVGTLTVGGLPVTGGAGGASFVSSFKWGVNA